LLPVESVPIHAADQRIPAETAAQSVATGLARQPIAAGAAEQLVVPASTEELIVPCAPVDAIGALGAGELLAPGGAANGLGLGDRGAHQQGEREQGHGADDSRRSHDAAD
jgi:hypothetical protein